MGSPGDPIHAGMYWVHTAATGRQRAGFTAVEQYPLPSSVLHQMYARERRLDSGPWTRAKAALHTLVMTLRWQHERASRSGLLVLRKPPS